MSNLKVKKKRTVVTKKSDDKAVLNVIKTKNKNINKKNSFIRFIDLFAGMGGTRLGFENACRELNLKYKCVFTSEIKEHAISSYIKNFNNSKISGDITKIKSSTIPNFDFLLAGFPCQPFSSAGKRNGFLDERGGLFFTIHRILKEKKPSGFLLENVDGLVSHNKGKTLKTILSKLESLDYRVSWKILDASDFGVPQKRKRIYIVGHRKKTVNLNNFSITKNTISEHIEKNKPFKHTEFTKTLSQKFSLDELAGKSIKDKRGGKNNIHSWDLELKGKVSKKQKVLLDLILRKRRNKKWAEKKGIEWMDGMPLTLSEIKTFYKENNLKKDLDSLVKKGYLKLEHPKQKIVVNGISKRVPYYESPKGYNIVSGKLSFPIVKILHNNEISPTLVATEAGKIGVVTKKGVRAISVREGLRFSGFPEDYSLEGIGYKKAFDLIGNTVMPPVIKAVSLRLLRK